MFRASFDRRNATQSDASSWHSVESDEKNQRTIKITIIKGHAKPQDLCQFRAGWWVAAHFVVCEQLIALQRTSVKMNKTAKIEDARYPAALGIVYRKAMMRTIMEAAKIIRQN